MFSFFFWVRFWTQCADRATDVMSKALSWSKDWYYMVAKFKWSLLVASWDLQWMPQLMEGDSCSSKNMLDSYAFTCLLKAMQTREFKWRFSHAFMHSVVIACHCHMPYVQIYWEMCKVNGRSRQSLFTELKTGWAPIFFQPLGCHLEGDVGLQTDFQIFFDVFWPFEKGMGDPLGNLKGTS